MAGQPPRTIHGYELVRLLGTGSFGEVWEARAPGDHKAAVKLIHLSKSQAGAVLELSALKTMKGFDHYHLVKTFASYNDPDQVVIIMELAAGTLFDRLKYCVEAGQPGIPPDELLRYMKQTAEALDYLHAEGVIHRDIKPANILLFNLKAPFVKLGDCGLVREWTAGDETMTTLGTPAYIAPEMWARKGCARSDQYSLAVTYVELRLERRPLSAPDRVAMALAHAEEDPDLDGLTEAEKPIVRKALAKEPGQRYPTCVDFVAALEQALEVQPFSLRGGTLGLTFKMRPPAAPRQLPRPKDVPAPARPGAWLSHVVLGLVGVLALVLVVVVAAPFLRRPAAGPEQLAGKGSGASKEVDTKPPPNDPPDIHPGKAESPTTFVPRDEPRPPPPKVVVIPGFRSEAGKTDEAVSYKEERYPARIVCEKHPEMVFRLMLPRDRLTSDWDPPPFYLLETKVTNAMYERFADAMTQAGSDAAGEEWRRGARGRGGEDLPAADRPQYPVYRVTRGQAAAFAAWVGSHTRAKVVLPTANHLDRAAEYQDAEAASEKGPFTGANVAVGRRESGPRPVTAGEDDQDQINGVRGLAGNGREWTQTDFPVGGRALAVYRGRSYTAAEPLTYRLLAEQRRGDAVKWTWDPDRPDATMGFRVAVEVK